MSKEFFSKIDSVFKEILMEKKKIIVVDVETNKPIEGLKYEKLLFDSDLNMYKREDDDKIVEIRNKKAKAILNVHDFLS